MCPDAPCPPTPVVRRVRPADAPAMQAYLAALDADSRRLRFHGAVNPAAPSLLRALTGADGTRRHGFVAVQRLDDGDVIVGEAQCCLDADGAEFAISVAAAQRGRGVAAALMAAVRAAATLAGAGSLHGEVLSGNGRMAAFMARQGFTLDAGAATEPGVVRFARTLAPVPAAPAGAPWWQRLLGGRAARPFGA